MPRNPVQLAGLSVSCGPQNYITHSTNVVRSRSKRVRLAMLCSLPVAMCHFVLLGTVSCSFGAFPWLGPWRRPWACPWPCKGTGARASKTSSRTTANARTSETSARASATDARASAANARANASDARYFFINHSQDLLRWSQNSSQSYTPPQLTSKFLTNTLNFVLLSLTNLLGGTFFQVLE